MISILTNWYLELGFRFMEVSAKIIFYIYFQIRQNINKNSIKPLRYRFIF